MKTKVTKTGDGELLIYKYDDNGTYINIIIDNDGDIEIMYISHNREESWNKVDVSIDEAINFWNNY